MKKSVLLRTVALFCVMACMVVIMPTQPIYAETLAEKIERLKSELEDIDNTISSLEGSIDSYEQQRQALATERTLTEELLEANQQSIDETQALINNKQEEISQKRQVIYDNEQLLQERLIAIYKRDTANPLSTLLSANSFSEFLTMAGNLQTITQHDTDLLNMLANEKAELENQLAELDSLLEEYNQKTIEFNETIDRLAANISAQNANISAAEAALEAQAAAREETYEELEASQAEQARIQAALKNQGSTSTDGSKYTGGTLTWPVPGFYSVSCEFGSADPNGAAHRGMDINGSGISGAAIVSGADGVVLVAATAHYSYGNYVVVDHGGGLKTLYAHCSSLNVSVGQTVSRGDTIAFVGSTGFSTGYHLHFEVHLDGVLQNPRGYLAN